MDSRKLVFGPTTLGREFKPEILMRVLVSYYGDGLRILSGDASSRGNVCAEFVRTRDLGGKLVLSAGSKPFKESEKASTTSMLLAADLGDPTFTAKLLSLCADMGWDDCRSPKLVVHSSDEIECSEIARLPDLFARLSTVVMRIRAAAGGLTLTFKGKFETHEILDEEALRRHLESDGLTEAAGATYRQVAEAMRAKR